MLTQEQNDVLTRTSPGTLGGDLLRRYWQPVALSEELPPGGAPLPIRLLGEDLVLFRVPSSELRVPSSPSPRNSEPGTRNSEIGLLGLHCAHRGADLSYGRLEDGGLRCIYHGWLYNAEGRCLEQPGEPAGSTFHERIRQTAYPCQERGEIIFAYLGPGEPPLLPAYEFLSVAPEFRYSTKIYQDCNYLQGNEGNIDPAHLSFLHRISSKNDLNQSFNARVTAPEIHVFPADFGLRIYTIRALGGRNYVRVTNFMYPNLSAVAGDREGYSCHWHVPIDDTSHWRYEIRFNRFTPVDKERIRGERAQVARDYRFIPNRSNHYNQDRESMKTWSFSGLGRHFALHDACVTEGAGPIQDRTQEHLGSTDKAIVAARNQLLLAIHAVKEGRDPPHVVRDEAANQPPELFTRNDVILPADVDWREFWRDERKALEMSTRDPVAAR